MSKSKNLHARAAQLSVRIVIETREDMKSPPAVTPKLSRVSLNQLLQRLSPSSALLRRQRRRELEIAILSQLTLLSSFA